MLEVVALIGTIVIGSGLFEVAKAINRVCELVEGRRYA
jgi:hypothetical protein